MLLRYNVSNFKSIGHDLEFSMLPSSVDVDDRYVTIIPTKMGDWKVLRRGGLFGPNASGKSSFIQSIKYAKAMIVDGKKSGTGTGVIPFRSDIEGAGNASTFQFVLYIDGEVYEYGFSVTRQYVVEEWLNQLESDNMQMIFVRNTDDMGNISIDINYDKDNVEADEIELIRILRSSMKSEQKNQLFLYKLYDNAVDYVKPVIEWFSRLQFIFPHTKISALPLRLEKDQDLRTYISESLRNLDTGVESIEVSQEKIDFYEYAEKINLPQSSVEKIETIKNGIVNINGKYFLLKNEDENEKCNAMLYQLVFKHNLNGKEVSFQMADESDGTKRLTDLLPMVFSIEHDVHSVYLVDEIDRSLHTKLSQYLLNKFSGKKNIYSQIIFTAHDVNLINLKHFAQDEIWFIEKSNEGESKIHSLSDYDLLNNQDVLKGYLNGRFGAVPVIRGEEM